LDTGFNEEMMNERTTTEVDKEAGGIERSQMVRIELVPPGNGTVVDHKSG